MLFQFRTWLYANQLALPDSFQTGRNVVSNAHSNLVWGNSLAVDVFVEVRRRNAAAAVTTSIILIIAAVTAHLFNN